MMGLDEEASNGIDGEQQQQQKEELNRPYDFHCRFQIVFIYICILSASGSGD